MAKIVYFLSPFDDLKKKELELNKSIGDVLIDLGIEKESLSIIINGECPNDCDLEYVLQDSDTLEIRRIVNGEGSSNDKTNLATIIQIAALVAVTILSAGTAAPYTAYLITGILVTSSLVTGALLRRAAELSLNNNTGGFESDISANQFSLTNINNSARPLAAMPLMMGSHRMAPDFQADAFRATTAQVANLATIDTIGNVVYPGNDSSNGVLGTLNNWATMPADYIATGFPKYELKIAPYHFLDSGEALTPATEADILNSVKQGFDDYAGTSHIEFKRGVGNRGFTALIVYHSNASDPFYGSYNYFFFLSRIFELYGNSLSDYTNRIGGLFAGVAYDSSDTLIFSSTGLLIGPTSKELIKVSNLNKWYWVPIVNSESLVSIFTKMQNELKYLNNFIFTSANKASSFTINSYILIDGITSVISEGIDCSLQVFNYGIGDLTISDRRIGLNDVPIFNFYTTKNLYYSRMDVSNSVYKWLVSGNNFGIFEYSISIFNIEKKVLYNGETGASGLKDPTDLNTYNWIYLEGKPDQNIFRCEISGSLYSTSGGGLTSNSCYIQVQFKKDTETTWSYAGNPGYPRTVFGLANNNTKKISYEIFQGAILNKGERINIRIRKITPEYVNNENNNSCKLYVDKICFFKPISYFNYGGPNMDEKEWSVPAILEGVGLTALVVASGQTNQYSALVESKCWVYDFDLETWSWAFNRNPAFWFLYYSRGGFLNKSSNAYAPFSYPYSPTTGWQNYPDHPNNIERIFGVGLTDDKIDLAGILEWAQFCEENSLKFDMLLKDDTSCAEVLERIANVGRGSVTYYSGKLSVVWEDPEQVPTCMYGMGNIKAGSFSVNYKSSEPIRKVKVNYVNRETWETDFVEAFVPYSDPDSVNFVELTMEGVTETDQAQREVNILAARQYFQRRSYTWDVDFEGLIAKRGDLVYLSHDSTQYGYSGRVNRFIMSSGAIVGIETSSILDSSINNVIIKEPDGTMNNYSCHLEGDNIYFDETYPLSKASEYISPTEENLVSSYINSIPEDFVFISGSKETPGKIVRIASISASDSLTFTITAIDEDPAMWAYEFEGIVTPESYDDSEIALSLDNVGYKDLGSGLLKINWENINGDMIQIINEETGLPISESGSFTFTGGEVILELLPNTKYSLIIRPFAIGTPYKSTDKRIKVWLS